MAPDPPDRPGEDPDHPDSADPGLDIDARFAEIVAGWEPSTPEEEPDEAPPPAPPVRPDVDQLRGLFRPGWGDDGLETEASWSEEGHFVPPPPPPLPQVEPRRRLAWAALLGAPLVAVLFVGAGIRPAGWMLFLLVVAFVGGFSYLVATMRSGPPDDWSGDDGARI